MKRIDKFNVHFSNILKDKYHMNKDSIDRYWENKHKQEIFDNKKFAGILIGLGELFGTATFCVFYQGDNRNVIVPIILFSGIGLLTTKISVSKNNPYNLLKYENIDKDYKLEKKKYKSTTKDIRK